MNEHEQASVEEDRRAILEYMKVHRLEEVLNEIVNDLVKDRPDDPFLDLAQTIEVRSSASNKIIRVHAREIIGNDGVPMLEAEVETIRGVFRSVVANVGPFDRDHLPEEDCKRFGGRGLTHAVTTILTLLGDKLLNKDPCKQEVIDGILSEDPSYPANAVLALSIACCKAGAKFNEMELYSHVAALANVSDPRIPMPWFTIVVGGNFANNDLPFAGVAIANAKATTVREAMDDAASVFAAFPATCTRAADDATDEESGAVTLGGGGLERPPNMGMHGAYAPGFENTTDCLRTLKATISDCGQDAKTVMSVNMSVSTFASVIENDDEADEIQFQYELSKFASQGSAKILKNSGELVDDYFEWLTQFPLVSIEDGFEKKDSASLIALKEKVEGEVTRIAEANEAGEAEANPFTDKLGGSDGLTVQLIGNESIVNVDDIVKAEEKQTTNTCVLSLAKAGTVTKYIALNAKAESLGMPVVCVSEHDGDPSDVFASHLAVGTRAAQFRAGGLMNFGHSNKYNEFLRIADDGEEAPEYIGANFRK
jgi:enolase